jgi:serine/threonine protein kinase
LELLGSGGSGFAYRAQDEDGKDIVFKFFAPSNDHSFDFFEREINGLKITDRFIYADMEHRILIFKMIPGITFAKYLSEIYQKHDSSGLLHIELADIAKKTELYFSAVKEFYEKYGLLHGDVRPLNAIITPDGKMELIDLGQSQVAPVDPNLFSRLFRYYYDIAKLELHYWITRGVQENSMAKAYRKLLIRQAIPGREDEAEAFCHQFQQKYNLPADTCQTLAQEYQNLKTKTNILVSQASPPLMDLKVLAEELKNRFMFIEQGMVELKLSSLPNV